MLAVDQQAVIANLTNVRQRAISACDRQGMRGNRGPPQISVRPSNKARAFRVVLVSARKRGAIDLSAQLPLPV